MVKRSDQTARRYAKAMFDLSVERDAVDEYAAFAGQLVEALADEGFYTVMTRPHISKAEKIAAAKAIIKGLPEDFASLIGVMLDKKREDEIVPTLRSFEELYKVYRGIADAEITAAVPLTEAQIKRVAEALGKKIGKRVIATAVVDKSVIGGISVRVGGALFDATVGTALDDLRRHLLDERLKA